jgi:uncharacterized damage-inducible protein DinB
MTRRDDHSPPSEDAGEIATSLAFLRYQRESILRKLADLPHEVACRAGVGSGTSLAGLVKHLSAGERYWFLAQPVDDWEAASTPQPGETTAAIIATYRDLAARSDEVITACADFGATVEFTDGRSPRSMRWIMNHMIIETARHAGHADILREQIDGLTGR